VEDVDLLADGVGKHNQLQEGLVCQVVEEV
jgi:hypothetical protein